jgi:hypothetical protein
VRAFEIDLASNDKRLLLTSHEINKGNAGAIQLVKDLHSRYHVPTVHYTARAKSFVANDKVLGTKDKKPIYVIFDTGVTGMVLSQDLFDERYGVARENRERNLWGSVQVSFETIDGATVTLAASNPVTTPLEVGLPGFNGHLIVLGLAFLDGKKISIDINNAKLWVEGRA